MAGRLLATIAICMGCAMTAASAGGAGGPGAGFNRAGMGSPGRRPLCRRACGGSTIAGHPSPGRPVLKFMSLKGAWGIPVVAFDGTTDGLMADGRTLLSASRMRTGTPEGQHFRVR
jgi:hypothetical protein